MWGTPSLLREKGLVDVELGSEPDCPALRDTVHLYQWILEDVTT